MILLPVIVNEAPELMVRLLHFARPVITGLFGVPAGINTDKPQAGIPLLQLLARFQLLVVPSQLVTGTIKETVSALAVTGLDKAQFALEVNTQVTISPVDKIEAVYDEAVAPFIFEPLFFHWYAGLVPPFVIEL